MNEGRVGTNVICQVALVVRDIERTSKAWADVLGVAAPPIRVTAPPAESGARYKGKPTGARAKLAFFDCGGVRLELIEPIGEPSTWKDSLDARGDGMHHVAFQVKGTDAVVRRLAERGMNAVQQGKYAGGQYTYVDAEDTLGAVVELLENFDT